jgi:heat shock protein HslJ
VGVPRRYDGVVNSRWTLLLAPLIVTTFVACGSDDTENGAASLAGTEWTLDADSLDVAVPDQVAFTASFDAERIAGISGCNNYSGEFTSTDAGGLSIGMLISTQMACAPDVEAVETAYLGELAQVDAFQISGDTLVLSGGGADLLRFSRS